MDRNVFPGVSHAPISSSGPSVPQVFGNRNLRKNGLTHSKQIWYNSTYGKERHAHLKGAEPQRPKNVWDLLRARTEYEKLSVMWSETETVGLRTRSAA